MFLLISLIVLNTSFVFANQADNNSNKISIQYFWGDGCSHCAELEPWLNNFEKDNQDKVIITRHEIWKDKKEATAFSQLMNIYGIPKENQGTPTLIVNNKVLIGTTEIKAKLPDAVKYFKPNSSSDDNNNKILGTVGKDNVIPNVPTSQSTNTNKSINSTDLKAIFFTALVDSINPCAIMVLIILLSSLIVYQKENKKRIVLTAIAFISAVYITYFVIGFGLATIISTANISKIVTMIVGIIAVLVGLANIKDAFFYRAGDWAMEIPERWRTKLTKIILSATSPVGAFIAGMMVTFIELPCTGGPYLFGISIISSTTSIVEQILLLMFYNLIFISPLVFIAILVIKGMLSIENAEKLRNKNVKLMHLITGVIMLLVGIWALFIR